MFRSGPPAAAPSALLILLLSLLAVSAGAQTTVIQGTLLSTQDNHPVEFALVFLDEVHRSAMTDAQGRFFFDGIPAGHHTFHATRIGFEPFTAVFDLDGQDTLRVTYHMTPEVIEADEVIVEGNRNVGQSVGVKHKMEGDALRQNLGTTIAETLDEEPGLAMRSMGPAPARPVLRGLGGERLLVLENGSRTGDLSQTSSDHALVVDPLTADRLEIVRGPEALIHGPNTLAGAINVVRETVLSSVPNRIHASAALQGQSVSGGMAGGGGISLPLGASFALRANASVRTAGNVRTPEGRLGNTQLGTRTASAGLSHVGKKGFVGISGSWYTSDYGIPGGFIGAHPNGVSVDVERWSTEARAEWLQPLDWIRRLESVAGYTHYFHQEFESSGALGIEYGLLTWSARTVAYTAHLGPFEHGAIGFSAEARDYAAGGFSFTPATMERSVAAFTFQDFHLDDLGVQIGIRMDARQVDPSRTFTADIGEVRPRSFTGWSASVAAQHPLGDEATLGIMLMRGLRLPGIEELFSQGPHLAAYSFEVGNPDLQTEVGTGVELSLDWQHGGFRGSVAAYHNRFRTYIFPLNTGELNYRIYIPIYQYTGTDAVMTGAEGQIHVDLPASMKAAITGSWVRGKLTELDTPIPWMPPLKGTVSLSGDAGPLQWSLSARGASRQSRLGPFEETTSSYIVPDVSLQTHGIAAGMLHTITLAVDNLTDTSYRDHLSRVKSIMPEPGRNIRLVYRLYF